MPGPLPGLRPLLLALLLAGPALLPAKAKPLVAVLGTCTALTANIYPVDSVNWFDPARHSQVVFYAHLMFPLQPESGPALSWAPGQWHPPLRLSPSARAPALESLVRDVHFAEAEWLDPQDQRIAYYSLTFPARVRADWLDLHGRRYIPHTLAMAIGIKDVRKEAGQAQLPSREGQYTVRLSVDGERIGLAFFRMLRAQVGSTGPSQVPEAVSGAVQVR